MEIVEICQRAKQTSKVLLQLQGDIRNKALQLLEESLIKNASKILKSNQLDFELASKSGLTPVLLNRLRLTQKKIEQMSKEVASVRMLPDPLSKTLDKIVLDDGLILEKVSCPIGVIATVFESRPDAVTQISALAIKSGNALILKGGSEAINSNTILASLITDCLSKAGLPRGAVTLIETRQQVGELLKFDDCIDLVIPRGSNQFVRMIKENSRIPVLGHADGICHLYADESADINKLIPVMVDSKTQYPAACNALETLLLHKDFSDKHFSKIIEAFKKVNVEMRGCNNCDGIPKASEEDWSTEYGDLIVSIKIVNSTDQAIEHINKYGSGHTDSIISENQSDVEKFLQFVDSSSVMHNASTRFADGFRYGMGAEVGISTNKIHARGPVGLEGLTINRFILRGEGQILEDYSNGKKEFKHKRIE